MAVAKKSSHKNAARSRHLIKQAFAELLNEKDIAKITVTDIAVIVPIIVGVELICPSFTLCTFTAMLVSVFHPNAIGLMHMNIIAVQSSLTIIAEIIITANVRLRMFLNFFIFFPPFNFFILQKLFRIDEVPS